MLRCVVIPVNHVPAEAWFHVELGIPMYKCHPIFTQLYDSISTEEQQCLEWWVNILFFHGIATLGLADDDKRHLISNKCIEQDNRSIIKKAFGSALYNTTQGTQNPLKEIMKRNDWVMNILRCRIVAGSRPNPLHVIALLSLTQYKRYLPLTSCTQRRKSASLCNGLLSRIRWAISLPAKKW